MAVQFKKSNVNLELALPTGLSFLDLNGDSYQDIVAVSSGYNNDDLIWHASNRDGTVSYSPVLIHGSLAGGRNGFYGADIDSDGDIDLVTAETGDGDVTIWYNNGQGNAWSSAKIADSFGGATKVFIADFAHDTFADVVAVARDQNDLAIWRQTSRGAFSKLTIDSHLSNARAVDGGDVNGDGLIDLVAGGTGGLYWYRNNGGGANWSKYAITEGQQPHDVKLADLDNDGDLDVIFAADDGVYCRLNTGYGFSGYKIAGFSVAQVAVADIDRDGDIDLVFGNHGSNASLYWYSNNGDGIPNLGYGPTFTAYLIDSQGLNSITAVATGDADNDGFVDISIGTDGEDDIYWYRNELRSISISAGSDPEEGKSGSYGTFTFQLDGQALQSNDLANIYTVSGSATLNEDYTITGYTGLWEGFSSAQASINVINDLIYDPDETITLTLKGNGLSNGFVIDPENSSATVTIKDLNPVISLTSVSSPSEPESESDLGVVGTITISLNTKATSAISLPYSLSGAYEDLVLDDDANPNNGGLGERIKIGVNDESKIIYLFAKNDFTFEEGESVTLTLLPETPTSNNIASGDGYRVDTSMNQAVVMIGDNEPTVSLGDVKHPKEDSTSDDFIGFIDIELDRAVTKQPGLSVFYSITGGTATQFTDYLNTQGRITSDSNVANMVFIPKGARSARLYLSALPDAIAEQTETITIALLEDLNPNQSPAYAVGNSYAIGTKATATVNIIDSSFYLPSLVIFDRFGRAVPAAARVEADSNGNVALAVRLSSQPTADVAVQVNEGALTFTPINWDRPQSLEFAGIFSEFPLNIRSTSSDSQYDRFSHDITLVPDDGITELDVREGQSLSPELTPTAGIVLKSNVTEGMEISGELVVLLSTPAPTGGLLINLLVSGTATPDEDYRLLPSRITIPAGQSSFSLPVVAIDDNVMEMDETIIVSLQAGDGYIIDAATSSVAIGLSDDDEAGVIFATMLETASIATSNDHVDVSVLSFNGAGGSFSLALKRAPNDDVSINVRDSLNPNISKQLIFTPQNWTSVQSFTLSNLSPTTDDDTAYQLVVETESEDSSYQNLILTYLLNTNRVTTPISTLLTTEASDGNLLIKLASQPSSDVRIDLSGLDSSENNLSSKVLTFTSLDWDQYQSLDVNGLKDDRADGDITYNLQATATSDDVAYQSLITFLKVTNEDIDSDFVNAAPAVDDNLVSDPPVSISLLTDSQILEADGSSGIFRISVGQGASADPVNVRYSVITDARNNNATEGVDYQSFNLFSAQVGDQSPFTGIDIGSYSAPALFDLDMDGDLDLITGTYYGTLEYYENSGDINDPRFDLDRSNLNPFIDIDLNGNTMSGYSTPVFADLDGDADSDLILGSNDGTIRFYQNNALIFTEVLGDSNPFHAININTYSTPSLIDLDSDGDLDLFVGSGDGRIHFYHNIGTENAAIYREDSSMNPFRGIDMGDQASIVFVNLDADSDYDAVLTGDGDAGTRSINSLQYWQNIGSQSQPEFVQDNSFFERSNIVIPDNARPAFGDLNGDSEPDLIFGQLDGIIDYYKNQASGEISIIPGQYADIELISIDDLVDEGTETVTVLLNTNQGYYLDPDKSTVEFKILDDDNAAILLTDSLGKPVANQLYSTSESDLTSREFQVKLNSQPTDSVRIYLASTQPREAKLSDVLQSDQSRISLEFTPTNWNIEQSFFVTPQDDQIDDELVDYRIDLTVKSGDDRYHNLQSDSILFSNRDNDQAGLTILPLSNHLKDGSTSAFQISLQTQPRSLVQVHLVPRNGEIRFNQDTYSQPIILSFNEENWSVPQAVSVSAVDDSKIEYIHSAIIDIKLESDDDRYANLSPLDSIDVLIQDNDEPIASLNVAQNAAEEAVPGFYTIALNTPADSSLGAVGLPINYRVISTGNSGDIAINGFDYQTILEDGSVRIAPGQLSSPLVIAPIDNFIDDGDHQVIIELQPGDGYVLSESISNTLVIVNNDKSGVQIIQSGIVPVVEEGDEYSFYLSLLSEPTADTMISFAATPDELDPIHPITFSSDNWYVPQSVTIRGRDENLAEVGENHAARLSLSFEGAKEYESLADSTWLDVNIIDRTFDSANTALGLQYTFEGLMRAFDGSSLPLIGSASKLPFLFDDISESLVSSVATTNNLTAWKLDQIWREVLAPFIDEGSLSHLLVSYEPDAADTPFTVSFTSTYRDQTIPLASDLAIPALEVGIDGDVQLDLSYEVTLGYGILKSGGYYLDTDRTSIRPTITLDAINLDGIDCINGLSVDFQDNGTNLDLDYTLTINPEDLSQSSNLSTDDLSVLLTKSGQDLFSYFSYEFSQDSDLFLSLKASPDYAITDYFPGLIFEYYVEDLPLINYADLDRLSAEIFYVNIVKAALDVQNLARGYVHKYVNIIDEILSPFYPIIDTLNADTKFLTALELDPLFDGNNDKKVSVLEILMTLLNVKDESGDNDALKNVGIKGFDDGDRLDFYEFLDALNELIEVVRVVNDYVSDDVGLVIGDDDVLIDIGSVRAKAVKGELEIESIQPVDGDILGRIQSNPWATDDLVELIDKLLALDGLEIPLLTDFLTVARLLTGDANVDFLTYDVPDLDVDLSVNLADIGLDAILPDYGLESVLELAIGLSSNLYFAYDDYGLNLWREELCEDLAALGEVDPEDDHPKNELLLLEGFYVHDLDGQGRDINELGASFGVDIGLEANAIVAKARMTGGVQSDNDAKIDFVDSNDDGILRYGEISPLFSGDLSVLDVSGEIEAFLNTKVQVGVDAGLFEVMETILDIDIATYKLWDVEYALGKIGLQGFASQSALQAGKVFFDANFNGIIDDGEPVSLSFQDGGFSLSIARSLFDRNRNGRIDNEEGRLVILDAVDTSTGLPQETPLFALVDSMMITPLTSLIQKLVQAGVDPVLASDRIRHVFGLSSAIDLASYNPASALSLGDFDAMQVYVSHVIAQSSISVLSQFVAGLMQQSPAEVAERVIDAIAQCLYYEEEASFQNPDFLARLFDAVVIESAASFNQNQRQQLSAIFSRILIFGSQLITSKAAKSTPDDVVSDLTPLKIGLQHDLGNILRQLGSGLLSPSFVERSLDAWQARLQDSADTSNLESLILILQSLGISRDVALQQLSEALSLPDDFDRFPSDASPFQLHLQTLDHALSLLFQLGGQVLQSAGLSDPREASWLISRATAQICFSRALVELSDADLVREIVDAAARSADIKIDAAIKDRKANRISALITTLARLNLESSSLDQALDQQRQILGQALGFESAYHQPGPQIIAYEQKEWAYFLEAIDTQIQLSALHVSGSYELGLSTTDGRSIVLLRDLPGSDDSALAMPFETISSGLMSNSESRFFGSIASAPDDLSAFMDEGLELYLHMDGRRYSSLSPEDLVISTRPGGVVSLAFMDTDELIAEFSIQAPIFLTPGLDPGQKVLVDLEIARAAAYDNTIGIYRLDDITGAIEFADRYVMPGDPDYERLAVERARAEGLIFDSPTNMSVEQHILSLSAASGFGLFLIADNTVENYLAQKGDEIKAYFSYGAANHDGSQRVASLGNGFYGFEDGFDQDFNDALLRFSISNV